MSFALEYRKKMQAEARRSASTAAARPKAGEGFVVLPADKKSDTRGNRRRVLAALSLAAIILSVFNSGALVTYTGGIATSNVGLRIAIASEEWHALMEENKMTHVVESIREVVSAARYSSWQDFAAVIVPRPRVADEETPDAPVPASTTPPVLPAIEEEGEKEITPEPQPGIEVERTRKPVMKAEAEVGQ